jgi:hypothetical protein
MKPSLASKWKPSGVTWMNADKRTRGMLTNAWTAGELSWKLNPNQLGVYRELRAWEKDKDRGHLYALDISRRWGKSTLMVTMAFEDAIRNGGWRIVYCAPTNVMVKKILLPLVTILLQDCPEDLKPEYFISEQRYVFKNGSTIELVGMDVNPDRARGTFMDRGYLDECAFFDNLEYVLFSILYPQMQMRENARIIAGSTPPVSPSHYWSSEIIPAAINDNVYQKRVIDDNPMLSKEEIDTFCNAIPGGRKSVTCRREYYCEHIADSTLAIVPEWNDVEPICFKAVKPPMWRDCYVSLDPGWRDLTGVLFGYWWFEEKALVIEDEIAEPQLNSRQIAELVKEKEKLLWGGIRRRIANSLETKPQPYRRVSDNDHRLIHDLTMEHQLQFVPTQKDNIEQQVNALRVFVSRGKLFVHPRCVKLNQHLKNGVWKNLGERNKQFGSSGAFGHYDLIAALVYMLRNVDQHRNPYPQMERYVAGIKQKPTQSYGLSKPSKWRSHR